MKNICDIYQDAIELHKQGINVISTDEKTGIQAIKIIAPSIGATRTEADFLAHIQEIVKRDEKGKWIFIVDQLNTHQSASLVEWIASVCQYQGKLGKKGESGILKSMETRAEF